MSVSVFIGAIRSQALRAGHCHIKAFHALRAGNRDAAIIHVFNEVTLVAGGVGLLLSAV